MHFLCCSFHTVIPVCLVFFLCAIDVLKTAPDSWNGNETVVFFFLCNYLWSLFYIFSSSILLYFYCCTFSFSFCCSSPYTLNLPPSPSHISRCVSSRPFIFFFPPVTLTCPASLTGAYSGVCAAVKVCVWNAVTLAVLVLLGLNNLAPVVMWTFSRLLLPNPLHLFPNPPACKTAWKHKST